MQDHLASVIAILSTGVLMTQKDVRKAVRADAMDGRTPCTIYEALQAKLGRAPTSVELRADVKRILEEALIDRAERGKLAYQRRRP